MGTDATWVGIDTHKDTHVICVLNQFGEKTAQGSYPTNATGYEAIASAIGDPGTCRGVGIEGTSSFGAGLTRYLANGGYPVFEVLRPRRDKRRRGTSKNDFIDAERAARDVMAGNASAPKSQDGWVEAARYLIKAHDVAVRDATNATNTAKAMLITAPDHIRTRFSQMGNDDMMAGLARRRTERDTIDDAVYAALRSIAKIWKESRKRAGELEEAIRDLVSANAPALLQIYCCGPICAAKLAVAAGDNPERLKGEAAYAALCGVAPIEASSGKYARHRLNRGGNRQANRALDDIARLRMCHDRRTREYVARRTAEGKSRKEIKRCLKRYIVREVYHALLNPKETKRTDGRRLLAARKSLGLTQAKIGEILGVASIRISEIERGISHPAELEERYRKLLQERGCEV